MFSTNLKEILARFAAGKLDEIPESIITPELDKIIQDIYKAKQELHKPNVLSTAHKMHPQHINPIVSDDIADEDLIFIVENEHVKNSLIEFDLKLTDALTRNKDNPLFNWGEFTEKVLTILKPKNQKGLVFLDELSFETERVVASWGLPTLDKWLEGGITESSFTIFYASSNTGKTQAVTIDMSARLIAQGKIPLIIALEGSPRKIATKIIATLAGLADTDPKDYTDSDKERLLEISKNLPHIPIINKGCKKKWEIDKLIQQYGADVVIYDQLTISGNGRDWESMASICEVLKQISIGSGVPVIALTQSSAKNYNGVDDAGEENLSSSDYIKYSQAVFEDATHVIKISKHDNTNMRSFTVQKTKDDNTAKKLPIRLVLELTGNGYVERYWRNSNGIKFELDDDIMSISLKTPRVMKKTELEPEVEDIPELPRMRRLLAEPSVIDNIVLRRADATYIKTELGDAPVVLQDGGVFSNEAWQGTPDRLEGSGIPILQKISRVFKTNLPNMPEYGETIRPNFLLRITSEEIPEAFRSFYD